MGVMDEVNANLPPPGQAGSYVKGTEKEQLYATRQPFQLMNVYDRLSQFKDDKNPTENKQEWVMQVALLRVGAQTGALEYMQEDDGEGGQHLVQKLISVSKNGRRDMVMSQLRARCEAAAGQGLGPLKLDKEAVPGQGQKAWVLADWTQEDLRAAMQVPAYMAPAAAAAPPAPATPRFLNYSDDGTWGWDGAQWHPIQAAPPPPPAPVPIPPPPAPPAPAPTQAIITDPSGKFMLVNGQWEPLPPLPAEAAAAVPAPLPNTAQPIPPTRTVQGGDGEGGLVAVTQVMGPVREAVYQGEGVIRQPNGNETQAPGPERPLPGPMPTPVPPSLEPVTPPVPPPSPTPGPTPATEPPPPPAPPTTPPPPPAAATPGPPAPPPPPAPPAAPVASSGPKRSVNVSVKCESCQLMHSGPAFQNMAGEYVTTHACTATGKTMVIKCEAEALAALAATVK